MTFGHTTRMVASIATLLYVAEFVADKVPAFDSIWDAIHTFVRVPAADSAAIFASLSLEETTLQDWQKHLQINLTAPFLLSQAFAKQARPGARIVNILDWRALRPGADHFPYTISKSSLAALTRSLAVALAPDITVNGLALGAILPPADGNKNPDILKNIPLKRWANENEVESALLFLLTCPPFSTGEIIHVDGGRHLV